MNIAAHQFHIPVLSAEVIESLGIGGAQTIVDATFGGGGYAQAILNAGAFKVIAFDRDPDAIKRSEFLQQQYPDRFQIHHACFSELDKYVDPCSVNSVVFDFGVSSFQIDDADRGFSFRLDGPLDMRMGVGAKLSAADVVNTYSEQDLADIIYFYGEEKKARIIAKAIVSQRLSKSFSTTLELADLVRSIVKRHNGIDPATLTFQALRIFVNSELEEIEKALQAVNKLLVSGGRLVTVAFHSLEDRIVKNHCKKSFIDNEIDWVYGKVNSKTIAPSKQEIKDNPRSRSAKLRAYVKREKR